MTRGALVIGEAVVDVVVAADGSQARHPGGSPANVALGLGRLGRPVQLLTHLGHDDDGRLITDHLHDSGAALLPGSATAERTPVATAHLDATGAATYEFDLAWKVSGDAEAPRELLVVHTGSIAVTLEPGASATADIVRDLRDVATVTYDPNARPSLMGDPADARVAVEQMVALADVVKVSDEDLEWFSRDGESIDDLAGSWLEAGPALVVITRGGDGATVLTADHRFDVAAPAVKVADTVGAGDSFMGGLIDGLWAAGLLGAERREGLRAADPATLRRVVERCIAIAAITVSRSGANPPTLAELA
ncbi:carbohydrate kinase family protein [Demequina flava]|uniref:carbohydrate kinase family protein n=1 Tax=Demequina flava TaxID=1095025 RepID=UPI0007802182|nr:carbohydrate kinase [Demequina flava]